MRKIIATLIFVFISGARVFAAPAPVSLLEDDEKIMRAVLADGSELASAWVCYETKGQWYLPFEGLVQDAGFAIQSNLQRQTATGFILEESKTFELDLKKQMIWIAGKELPIPEGAWIDHDGEWWVRSDLVEKIFPLKFRFDEFLSQINVDARAMLPSQLKKKRDQDAYALAAKKYFGQKTLERIETPDSDLSVMAVDEQLSFEASKKPGSASLFTPQSTTQVSGQVMKLDALASVSVDRRALRQPRLTLARRELDGFQVGPANLTQAEFVDVTVPKSTLLTNAGFGRGAMISNYPLNRPSQFGEESFSGFIPDGWDVELYQADILLDRTLSQDGRYLFAHVPLYYGNNSFKLVFYGPQGQRREEFKNRWVGPEMIPAGKVYYQASYVNPFGGDEQLNFQVEKSLFQSLSTTFNYANQVVESETLHFAKGGLATFNPYFFLQGEAVVASNEGKGADLNLQVPLSGFTLTQNNTYLNRAFKSDLYNRDLLGGSLKTENKAELFAPSLFSFFLVNRLSAGQDTYYDIPDTRYARYQFSFGTGVIQWNHSAELDWLQDGRVYLGSLNASINRPTWFLRATLDYTDQMVRRWEGEWLHRLSETNSWSARLDKDFETEVTELSLGFNKTTRKVTWTSALTYGTDTSYSFTSYLSFSIGKNIGTGEFELHPDQRAQTGQAWVRVYLDSNHNGIHDPGEPYIDDVGVTFSGTMHSYSDKKGNVTIPLLTPNLPVSLSVIPETLSDPMLKPVRDGVEIVPKLGKMSEVELGAAWYGEVEGQVFRYTDVAPRPMAMQIVIIENQKGQSFEAKTDRDGYYLLEKIPPGTYRLSLKNPSNSEEKVPKTIFIPEDGGAITGQNFYVGIKKDYRKNI